MIRLAWLAIIGLIVAVTVGSADDERPVVRMIRAYGGTSEVQPPVVAIEGQNSIAAPAIAQRYAPVEVDVSAANSPNVYVRVTHGNADWT